MYRRDSDSEKVPAAPYDRLTDTPTYAARMYKVQLDCEGTGLGAIRLGCDAARGIWQVLDYSRTETQCWVTGVDGESELNDY